MTFAEYIALEQKHNAETVKTYEVLHELPFASGDEAEAAYKEFCKRERYTLGSNISRTAFHECHRYFSAEYVVDLVKDCKRFIQFGRDIEFTKAELFDGLRRGGLKVCKVRVTADDTAYLTFFHTPVCETAIFNLVEWGVLDKGSADEEMRENIIEMIDELKDDPKRIATEIWNAWCDKCEQEGKDPDSGLSLDTDED